MNDIARPSHCLDRVRIAEPGEFRPQAAHVAFDDARAAIEAFPPDPLDQHAAGHDLAAVAHQFEKKAEFLLVEIERSPVPAGLLVRDAQLDTSHYQAFGTARAIEAPDDGDKPCMELLHVERFDEIVVGTCLYTLDAVSSVAERAEHEDRRTLGVMTNAPKHLHSVHSGKHPVEHDGIEFLAAKTGESGLAIGGSGRIVAELAQARGYQFGN